MNEEAQMFVIIPNGELLTVDMIHEIEKAAIKAYVHLGFSMIGTDHNKNGEVVIKFRQFAKCVHVDIPLKNIS
jgi:hypothetical protein